jgi:hypothetical protein
MYPGTKYDPKHKHKHSTWVEFGLSSTFELNPNKKINSNIQLKSNMAYPLGTVRLNQKTNTNIQPLGL